LPVSDRLLLLTEALFSSVIEEPVKLTWWICDNKIFSQVVQWTITRTVFWTASWYLKLTKWLGAVKFRGCISSLCRKLTNGAQTSILLLRSRWFWLKLIKRDNCVLQWQFVVLFVNPILTTNDQ
jgi:hypothetical protein